MSIIHVPRYYAAANPDYVGNPLIEVLPPLTKKHVQQLLTSTRPSTAEDRTHSADLRVQYVQRLFRFFIPFSDQVEFAYSMWSTICQSYTRWDPTTPSAQQEFNEMCESLLNNTYTPGDELALFDAPHCITRFGTPGCGKTEVPKRLLRMLCRDGTFRHPELGIYQRLFVWVEAPSTKTEKALSYVVYDALYELLMETGTSWKRLPSSASSTVLAAEAAVIARKLNIGIVVIDELQHCIRPGIGLDRDAMAFLTAFINRIRTPVLLLGTWEAALVSRAAMRLGRRTVAPGSADVMRLKPGMRWNQFIKALFTMQYTQQVATYSNELASVFYELTQGVPDIAVKLMALTQLEAIVRKNELIDKDLLRASAQKHLDRIAPAIRALRDGAKEGDIRIWDAEPVDFDSYFEQLSAEYVISLDTPARRRRAAAATRTAKVDTVASALTTLNMADEGVAKLMAEQAVTENPKKPAEDLVAEAIDNAQKDRSPKPTKNLKKQAAVDRRFAALVDDDIRKVVYLAGRAKSSVETALIAAGHLCNVTELITR